ncbi:LysM peptidoglycan-binding domain-containing protein [Ralstonia pseudosolanacearum]|uniref:LysM domain-containing protein n=1 Tax=Ralstonia solanacearum TaxID=305 RepID=A0AA92IEB8_RALSL|nr:LysM peptidoglycan-binding domain-containing protein [Ralstonia pseudosolanacearum]QCX49369.1 LysM domain-containing protein [Ralstonia pseudosolanacearum]
MLEQTVQGGITYQNQLVAYDTLGRMAHVEGMDGVKLEITYDKVGNKLRQTTTYNTESQRTVADYGQVLQTDESGNPVLDDAGNPVYMTEQIGSHTVYDATAHAQDQWFAYDAMNRQILVDGAANGNAGDLSNLTASQGHILSYDKNGNRISDESWGTAVVPEYSQNTDASGAPVGDPYLAGYTTRTGVITTWYGYDSLNRLSTVSTGAYGQQQTGTVQKVVPQVDESGNPVLDESGNPITNTVTTPVYSEVALDRSHAVTLDVRRYDGANRVVSSGPVSLPANGTGVASGTIVSSGNTGPLHASYIEALAGSNTNQPGSTATTTRYDAAGRVLSQHVVNEVDGTRSYDVSYEKTVVTGTHTVQVQTGTAPVLDESGSPTYDESGNAITTPVYGTQTITDTAQVSTYDAAGNALGYRVTQNGTTTDYTFSQALYEGYQEGGVSAVSSAGSSGSTGEQYDANGFLVGLTDSTQGANNRSFVNDANGHILRKNQQGNLLNQLVVNGQVMGTYGVGTDPNSPTNSEGNPNYTTQGNFDLGYQPVTNSYPAAATGQYPIKSGDTLESIAQSAYGDSQLWYQIAQANGLSGNADLRVGQIINIPTRVGGTHNTANTFAPYDPSKVEGSTSPNLPAPSSDGGDGCGALGIIITIIVVVVTVIAQQYEALPAEVGAETAAGGATEVGAVGVADAGAGAGAAAEAASSSLGELMLQGAVRSIAIQALSNLAGAQQGFDWKSVALSAVSAGVGAGVSTVAGNAVVGAALTSVVTQGIGVATGLQHSFSWQSVAAAAAGAAVGAATTAGLNAASGGAIGATVPGRFVEGMLSGVAAGATTAVMRGGRVDMISVATDAFGNALGSSLAQANSAPPDVLGQKIAELQNSPIWNDPVAPSTDVLGDRIAELQRSPIWNDAGNAVSQASATSSLGQVGTWARSMESIVPTPQVVASGVDSAGRAWYQYDDGAMTRAVPSPVLDAQELPPLSKAELAASAPVSATGSTFGDRLLGGAVGGAQASFGVVNGMVRVAGNSVLQIGDILTFGLNHDSPIIQQAWVEQGALAAGGARLVTEPWAVASEAMDSIAGNYSQAQALQDKGDEYGASVIRARQTGEIAGAVLGGAQAIGDAARLGGVALRGMGLSDWNIKFADYSPNTLYSNPIPLQLEPIVTGSSVAETFTSGMREVTVPRSALSVRLDSTTGEGGVFVNAEGEAHQVGIISVVDGGPQFYLDNRVVNSAGESLKLKIDGASLTKSALEDTISAYKSAYGVAPPSLPGSLADSNLANFQTEFTNAKIANPGLSNQQAGDLAIRNISFGANRIGVGYGNLKTALSNFNAIGVPTRVLVNALPGF